MVALVLAGLGASAASAGAAGLAVDQLVTTNQTAKGTSVASTTFSTTAPNELLVAFISSDGPPAAGAQAFASVTGGGLTWQLRRRTNAQFGTSEIWQAVAPAALTNAKVTATRLSGSYQGTITVATFTGADTAALGATGTANGATGAPSVSLTTTRPGSWVWGAGSDWDRATARTVGPGQTKVAEFLASVGDTFWVQRQTATTAAAGTPIALGATAPANDRWNLASIEIVANTVDTQPPTAPVGLRVDSVLASRVSLSWSASTDDVGVTGYRVYRDGTDVGTAPATSFSDTGVTAGATYAYTVKAMDGAGRLSDASDAISVTTPAPDTTPPSVALGAPAAGATVTGTTTVTASASDDGAVAGVQFLLDGANLGAEHTTAPYGVAWDTSAATNGAHTLGARARDAAGNTATATTVSVTVANGGTDPAQVGRWGPLVPLPAVAIHSALTPAGKILLFQGDFTHGGDQYLFDPVTNAVTHLPDAAPNLFCAGQAVLADGRVQVAGGTSTTGGLGLADNTAFNWQSNSWSALAPMRYPRWYATATTLSDGKVLVTSGSNRTSADIVPIPELYSPSSNSWRELAAASRNIPYYPFIYQLPNGRIARLGASEEPTPTETLDLATNQWTTVDSRPLDGGSIANYAPGKFLKAGTASDGGFTGQSASTAYTIDMNQGGATWQPTAPMGFRRSFLNLTNLPDGTVLATGGGTDKSSRIDANGVLAPESWDPATGAWTKYAPMAAPRLYHSVAVLLPDGRVYVAGGGSDTGVTDQKSAQIFSPPYLFKGPRPTITSAPATVHYGAGTFVGTPDGEAITRVALIRTGSVTHAFDENARAMSLDFSQTVGGVQVQMPADGNLAPPGYYMLFLVNAQGVPSVASLVRFPAPYEDTTAPTAPTDVGATGQQGAATLGWTAATDDTAVTRYNVHRSSVSGFTAGAGNKVGETTTTGYTDGGVAPGVHYYRVTAEDGAGNVGPASAEVAVTVGADTTPPSRPAGLTGTAASRSATLAWSAATDDVGVSGYRVFRNGVQVGTSAGTSYTDTGLAPATTYSYTVAAYDAAENVSPSSTPPLTLTTAAAAGLALDKTVVTHQSSGAATIASPPLTTAQPGELLVAFLASDGPGGAGSQSFSAVTGGGLSWRLRQRTNSQAGTAEIWQAAAPATLTNVVVTATRSGGASQGAMTVAAFTGADATALGAAGTANASTGAPSGSLTTTRADSSVWASAWTGTRPSHARWGRVRRSSTSTSARVGDTYWTQRRSATTPAAGTPVTINDTAPTGDRWNLSLVEILPAPL